MTFRSRLAWSLTTGLLATLTACVPRTQSPPAVSHEPATRRDSVLEEAVRLGRLVHLMDEHARPTGALPPTLEPVTTRFPDAPGRDLWGRPIRYTPSGLRYELRAAGSDGAFETSDDIISVGQLGRVLPCETRHAFGIVRFEDSAPPCSDTPVQVVAACPELLRSREDTVTGRSTRDSTLVTGRNLVLFARKIDGFGRNMGALPTKLRQVVSNRDLTDAWRRLLRYEYRGTAFALRSAGADGVFESSDDIVVEGVLGHTLPCVFQFGNERVTCDAPPPPCPQGSVGGGRDQAVSDVALISRG